MTKVWCAFVVASFMGLQAFSQDDLLSMLESQEPEEQSLIASTFKGTRLINGHTIETRKKGALDFIIAHRFGAINGGSYELYGLDDAQVRFGLEYALTDRIYIGVGRSSFEKTYDGFVKFRVLRQSSGGGGMPVSLTYFNSVAVKTLRDPIVNPSFVEKLASTQQILIARKISPAISVQVMPTWVHKNLISEEEVNNDGYALGVGGRVKISPRIAIVAEYYYQIQRIDENSINPLAVGVDIETGGHVFQLQFTNARAMIPKGFVAETQNDFFEGGIHFGFNISRTFQIGK